MSLLDRIIGRVRRAVSRPRLLREMKRLGISYYAPNYVYCDRFKAASIVVDVGCGYEAEFSRRMIAKHGLTAFGVDPTGKHAPLLKELEQLSGGRFRHLPLAVSRTNGTLTFHESVQNESGSILVQHTNIQRDETKSYQVESVSLQCLATRLGTNHVDFLKLDLEGAEYDLFDDVRSEDLEPYDQVFVEKGPTPDSGVGRNS